MRILEDWAWYKVTVKALGTDLENLSAPLPNRRTPKSISPMFHVAPASHFSQHHPQGIPYARPPMHQRQPSLVPGAPTKGLVVNMQLPRSLKRPPYNEVSSDHIAAVAPELKDVPPEYVRKTLSQKASSMLAGVSSVAPQLPSSMPRSHLRAGMCLTAKVHSSQSAPTYPTHVLAVYSTGKGANDSTLALIPTHDIVLASHCALLARIPSSNQVAPAGQHSLPLLPLGVPVPAAFSTLHVYLYTHDLGALFRTLLPCLPSSFISALNSAPGTLQSTMRSSHQISQLATIALSQAPAANTAQFLMGQSQHISGLWKNTVALGVNDNNLWDAIDLAWDIIFNALNMATGQN